MGRSFFLLNKTEKDRLFQNKRSVRSEKKYIMEEFLIRFTAGFAYYLKEADAFLWGPPLLILLLGTHLFYTFRLKFVQKHLLTAFRLVIQKDDSLSGNVAPLPPLR